MICEKTIAELEDEGAILAIQDGNHGEKHPKATDYVEEGIPFVMANDLGAGHVDFKGCNRLSPNQAASLRIGFARTGDVLLTHKGTIGNVAVLGDVDPYVMLTPQVTYYRTNDEKLSNRYLAYAFREPAFQRRMSSEAQQSTRPYIGITSQRRLRISWVSRCHQERIVQVLASYDDLIENNRRRIELLEQSARELYKEWFVRFRFPGHEHVRIVDGVPEGWRTAKLGEIADTNARSHKKTGLPDEIDYIDISSVAHGRILSRNRLPSDEAPGRARRIAEDGDIIWSNVRPNLKAYALVLDPTEQDVFSTGFTILSAHSVPFTYLYLLVSTDTFVAYLVNQTTGASYPAVRPADFERAELVVPPENLLHTFHQSVESSVRLAALLDRENAALSQARDLLLPKLMSGEIAV